MSYGGQPSAQQSPYGQQPQYGQQLPYGQPHHNVQQPIQYGQQPQYPQPYTPQGQQPPQPQHAVLPPQQQQQQQQQPPHPHPQRATRFAHLAHLPMYVLANPAAAARAQNEAQQSAIYRQELLGMIAPEPQLSAADRATLMALKVTTGAEFVSMDKMVNGVFKAAYALETLQDISNRESEIFTLTRWALPREAGMELLVVDVMEHRSTNAKWAAANIVVKASRPVDLRVRGKWVASLSKGKGLQKGWTKSFNKKPVDSMALVVGGKDVPLELVIRVERAVVGLEMTPIYSGFYKEWVVPAN
jgi:hypothetical protein